MICLDTNYLIKMLVPSSTEAERVRSWILQGELMVAPAVAWYEFLCGPVHSKEIELAQKWLVGGILPLDASVAAEAARLFNAVGRSRRFRVDCMVAATAIIAAVPLATLNERDFQDFVPHGLQLI